MAVERGRRRVFGSHRRAGGAARRARQSLVVGVGQAIAHHGELLQGVFESADGKLHRGLLTLPYPQQLARATFWPNGIERINVRPTDRAKAARAVALTLSRMGYKDCGGDLTIESNIAIGHGYGSSTADVIASIRAAAASAETELRRSTISSLAVEAETASDAIAFNDQPVLFAHREGVVLEHFGADFPPLLVVGCRSGAEPLDTLLLPRARYSSEEIEQFRVLRGLASRAFLQQDPQLVGRVATLSARISQRHLPKPRFDTVLQMAEEHCACGVQVSHSGSVIGFLFDAHAPEAVARSASLSARLKRVRFDAVRSFSINGEGGAAR